tara:strand:+ start:230 stop:1162 length:933 start_codon:yes stop_codon:yes gene_type:complete
MIKWICVFFTFLNLQLSAQDGIVKSVMLDSVMVSAVSSGFSVEDFVDMVKSDTSFYQGFKNLRYYAHQYSSELEIYDVKNNSIGFLFRQGNYEVNNNKLVVKVDSSYNDGKIYNRRGKYRHYTPEFFDYIFFPEDTVEVSKYSSKDKSTDGESTNERNERDAKVIIFNPGSVEVEKSGSKKEKLAVFDESMQKYYDYIISKKTYKDTLECYAFLCRMKSDLTEDDLDEVLIRELVSYFDRNTFNVVYRKYVMQYDYWLIELNVTVDVEMGYTKDKLIPTYINYSGFWDIPFSKPEVADFKLWNSDFIITD